MILDCCHSGSGTRDIQEDGSATVRGLNLSADYMVSPTIGQYLGERTGSARSDSIPVAFAATGLASHVLLAACSEAQVSMEMEGRGRFSKALLGALEVAGTDKMTYQDLIASLPHIQG